MKILDFLKNIISNDNVNPNELKSKRTLTIAVVGVVAFFIVFFAISSTDHKERQLPQRLQQNSVFNDNTTKNIARDRWAAEAVDDLNSQKLELEKQQSITKALQQEISDLKEKLKQNKYENYNNNFKNDFQAPKPKEIADTSRITNIDNVATKERPLLKESVFAPKYKSNIIYTNLDNALESRKIIVEEKKEEEKKEEEPQANNFMIPASSVIKAVLLSGFDAPTMTQAKTNPAPILLKVTDFTIAANNFSQDVKDCFILAEGYGDLSSERAYLRTNTMTCVTNEGKAVVSDLAGFISGEDGKNGLRGRVVTKQGALIGRSIIAGFLSGIGEAFGNRGLVTSTSADGSQISGFNGELTTKDIVNQSLGKGVSNAADKIADFYLKMADQISPVIEISANREVEIILTKSMSIDLNNTETLKESIEE